MNQDYILKIKDIILDMIVKEEIDYDYDIIQKSKIDDSLDISSIDTVKIVLKLEVIFNIIIDDNYIINLSNLKDFNHAVVESIKLNKKKEEKIKATVLDIGEK